MRGPGSVVRGPQCAAGQRLGSCRPASGVWPSRATPEGLGEAASGPWLLLAGCGCRTWLSDSPRRPTARKSGGLVGCRTSGVHGPGPGPTGLGLRAAPCVFTLPEGGFVGFLSGCASSLVCRVCGGLLLQHVERPSSCVADSLENGLADNVRLLALPYDTVSGHSTTSTPQAVTTRSHRPCERCRGTDCVQGSVVRSRSRRAPTSAVERNACLEETPRRRALLGTTAGCS